MAAPLFTYQQKAAKQIHDDGLRTMKNGLIRAGIATPNVGPNSEWDVFWTALGNELAVGQANITITADQVMPDTCAGAPVGSPTIGFLDRWLALVGQSRRSALGSRGNCNCPCTVASTTVATGTQLTDTAGLRFLATPGTYVAGTSGPSLGLITVPVIALDPGLASNHSNGDTLKWQTTPPFCQSTALVGTPGGADGLSGGNDSEAFPNDEPPRARLLATLANPPKGGNWSQVAQWAQASSPFVQAPFIYPALNGPSTVYVAVCAAPQTSGVLSSTSKSRQLAASIVSGTVLPYIQGLLPENVYLQVFSTVDSPTDVAIQLTLPSATTASPPGPGGGWLDGTPWPSTNAGTAITVTSVTSSTVITVNAQTPPPVAGSTRIAWLSPLTWTVYSANVLSFTGSAGAYVLTLDTPLPGIATNHVIFPQSQNQATYAAAALQGFALMGPGEWSSNAAVTARAFRHPTPATIWPNSLAVSFLKQLTSAGTEVAAAAILSASQTAPAVPTTLTVGPNLLTPRNIGFYAA